MSEPIKVMAVVGSLHEKSVTKVVINHVAEGLLEMGCEVDLLDLAEENLPLVNTDTTFSADYYGPLAQRVKEADVFILGTPDYHGSMSGALKNFTDHFWKEFTGKLFAPIVASHEKGLTVHDQLRTIARQCYAWSLPYAVSFEEKKDVIDGEVASDKFRERLEMMIRDTRVYGELLADQRTADLAGKYPSFMARLREKN
ncbi:MAG: NAD(P)H-dependent oxidoreductase [Verrucomicrobiota bacterium]|nr:NAD(P)H-dependent oxidoreductase [Verrucomicrobiota bacterium]